MKELFTILDYEFDLTEENLNKLYEKALFYYNQKNYEAALFFLQNIKYKRDVDELYKKIEQEVNVNLYNKLIIFLKQKDYKKSMLLTDYLVNKKNEKAIKIQKSLHNILVYQEDQNVLSLLKSSKIEKAKSIVNNKNYKGKFTLEYLNCYFEEQAYEKGMQLLNAKDFKEAINVFSKIIDYKDCKNKIEEAKDGLRNIQYEKALLLIKRKLFLKAKEILINDPEYKNSQDLLSQINDELYLHKYENALISNLETASISMLNESIDLLNEIIDYKDSMQLVRKYEEKKKELIKEAQQREEQKIKQEQLAAYKKEQKKKALTILIPLFCIILLVFSILLPTTIIPNSRINKADELLASKQYEEAADIYLNYTDKPAVKNKYYLCEILSYLKNGNYAYAYTMIDKHSYAFTAHITYSGSGYEIYNEPNSIFGTGLHALKAVKNGYEANDWKVINFSYDYYEGDNEYDIYFTLEPIFAAKRYEISYSLGGGTALSTLPETYTIEDNFTIPKLTKPNDTFIGWKDTAKGTPTLNYSINNQTGSLDLIAVFQSDLDYEQLIKETKNYSGITSNTKIESLMAKLDDANKSYSTIKNKYDEVKKISEKIESYTTSGYISNEESNELRAFLNDLYYIQKYYDEYWNFEKYFSLIDIRYVLFGVKWQSTEDFSFYWYLDSKGSQKLSHNLNYEKSFISGKQYYFDHTLNTNNNSLLFYVFCDEDKPSNQIKITTFSNIRVTSSNIYVSFYDYKSKTTKELYCPNW